MYIDLGFVRANLVGGADPRMVQDHGDPDAGAGAASLQPRPQRPAP